jgi:hypothetical protein
MGSIRVTLKSGEESTHENVDCRLDGQHFIFSSDSKDVLWISADNVGAVRLMPAGSESDVDSDTLQRAADLLFGEAARLGATNMSRITHKTGLSLDIATYKKNTMVTVGEITL